jgi:hypothetical protein
VHGSVDLDRELVEVGVEVATASPSVEADRLTVGWRQAGEPGQSGEVDLGERLRTARDVAEDVEQYRAVTNLPGAQQLRS